jgi:oxygen-independent coproporphyrinogen-3 oxidase
LSFEKEELTIEQRYNEYILTSLRTIWGTDLEQVKGLFAGFYDQCLEAAQKYISSGDLVKKENKLFLTDKGKLIADRIAADLFV